MPSRTCCVVPRRSSCVRRISRSTGYMVAAQRSDSCCSSARLCSAFIMYLRMMARKSGDSYIAGGMYQAGHSARWLSCRLPTVLRPASNQDR